MTGLYPGFAVPHFVQNGIVAGERPNTFYVQDIRNDRISAFDTLEAIEFEPKLICKSDISFADIQAGDAAVYVYAFSRDNIAIGAKEHIKNIIRTRFDEIASKTFSARTAASFAGLTDRLTELNRRALAELRKIETDAASLWRDCEIFLPAIKEQLRRLGAEGEDVRLATADARSRLTVTVSLTGQSPTLADADISGQIKDALSATGLFSATDQVRLLIGSAAPTAVRVGASDTSTVALDRAKRFLAQKVLLPAIEDARSSTKAKNAARATLVRISRFRKIGDLLEYVNRFKPPSQGLLPFPGGSVMRQRLEDIHAEFVREFSRYEGQLTTIADFREGDAYSAFDLSIFTHTYNLRSGGIRPVGKIGQHSAVVANLTMSGGKYANRWIENGKSLKCYLKTRASTAKRNPGRGYGVNRAILDHPSVPVMVFTRDIERSDYIYQGRFHLSAKGIDADGAKWIELSKI